MVAALIAVSSLRAAGVANGLSKSPASASSGNQIGSITVRYLPQGMPISAQTCSSNARESSLYPFGRNRRWSICSAGAGSAGPVSIRRAVDRPIPVVDITSLRIRPRSVFDARAYAALSLFVTWRLAAIGILPSTRQASRSKKLRHRALPRAQRS